MLKEAIVAGVIHEGQKWEATKAFMKKHKGKLAAAGLLAAAGGAALVNPDAASKLVRKAGRAAEDVGYAGKAGLAKGLRKVTRSAEDWRDANTYSPTAKLARKAGRKLGDFYNRDWERAHNITKGFRRAIEDIRS